jgi:lysozyme
MIDDLIRKYEGCKLKAYPDPATGGLPITIGYGSTKKADGTNFALGDEITQGMAEALLCDYIQKNIVPVFDKIPYKLTEDQKCAIASLCYNVGVPSFLRSKLFTAICKKDYAEVCRQWDYGFKQNLKGLFKRRVEELHYFIKDI